MLLVYFPGFYCFCYISSAGKGLAGAVAVWCQALVMPPLLSLPTVRRARLSPSALPGASLGARLWDFNAMWGVLLIQEAP